MKTTQEKMQELIDCMKENDINIQFIPCPAGLTETVKIFIDGLECFNEITCDLNYGVIEFSNSFKEFCKPKTDKDIFNDYRALFGEMELVSNSFLEKVYVDFKNRDFYKITYENSEHNSGSISKNDKVIFSFNFS